MNIEFLRSHLSAYKNKQLCEFLEFGFPLGCKAENLVLNDWQTKDTWSCQNLIYLLDNIFIIFGTKLHTQLVEIPMGNLP